MRKFLTASLAGGALLLAAACSSGEPDAEPAMELGAGGGGAMASCMAFDPAVLRDMPVAFEGTATDVDGERVTLEVDHWYQGGNGDRVVLIASEGLEALIGGITFEEGETYLISASTGHVRYCGYSGEATDELRAGFEAAFGE
ncbi:MAG: hypothetical protein WD942_07335 [Dehalococcoidia bacterium]